MDPFFLVVIIEPTLQLAMGMDPKVLFNQSFETALKGRVLDELNRVARSSQNARVKSGFSLKFNLMSDDIAKMPCRDLTGPPVVTIPPNVFRAHLWPIQKDYSDMEALQSKIAPGPWKKGVVRKQIEGENGVGGRIPETGRNFAFVSLGWLERAVSGPPPPSSIPPDRSTRAGIWVGSMVLHELGHAMGIPVNGTGIMTGNISPDIDLDDPMLHFEVADAVKIR